MVVPLCQWIRWEIVCECYPVDPVKNGAPKVYERMIMMKQPLVLFRHEVTGWMVHGYMDHRCGLKYFKACRKNE